MKKKAKSTTTIDMIRDGVPIVCLIGVAACHVFNVEKAISFNYQITGNDGVERYGKGLDDIYTIVYIVLLLTGLRTLARNLLFYPLGRLMGIKKEKVLDKFVEQVWVREIFQCGGLMIDTNYTFVSLLYVTIYGIY